MNSLKVEDRQFKLDSRTKRREVLLCQLPAVMSTALPAAGDFEMEASDVGSVRGMGGREPGLALER